MQGSGVPGSHLREDPWDPPGPAPTWRLGGLHLSTHFAASRCSGSSPATPWAGCCTNSLPESKAFLAAFFKLSAISSCMHRGRVFGFMICFFLFSCLLLVYPSFSL